MTCADFDQLVTAYVDGSLSMDRLLPFYKHVCDCWDCRTHLTCYRAVVALLVEERRTSFTSRAVLR